MDAFGCHRPLGCCPESFAHSLKKDRLVAPVVNQHRLADGFDDVKELPPNVSLVLDGVRPEAVLNDGFAVSNPYADEVIEIAIWQAFDIQITGVPSILSSGLPTIWIFFSRIANAFNKW